MDARLFHRFCEIAYSKSGISIKPGKEALVSGRIAKRMRLLGLAEEHQYLEYLISDDSGDELVAFLDAISTNFTSFFREHDHFDLLGLLTKTWVQQRRSRLRLWSAASSTGEEPYSMAMTVAEVATGVRLDYKILATDISTSVLVQAKRGIYDAKRLEPLTPQQLKMFTRPCEGPGANSNASSYQVTPDLRERVVFKRMNLATPPYPMSGPLNAVFCRNVMIYFDHPVRQRLVSEVERLLGPDGFLFLGHAETLTGMVTGLKAVGPSVYTWPDNPLVKLLAKHGHATRVGN